nr:cyclin-dependent kinase B2-2 [Tanacetum cinerariifolium]
MASSSDPYALIIHGKSLAFPLDDNIESTFLDLLFALDSSGPLIVYECVSCQLYEKALMIDRKRKSATIMDMCLISMMFHLCRSVEFRHTHDVLHKDLKPHNLFLDRKTLMVNIRGPGLARAFTRPIKKYTHEVIKTSRDEALAIMVVVVTFELVFGGSAAVGA